MRLLMLDNADSFTYTLVDYLRQTGAECIVHRNDQSPAAIIAEPYEAVVLSPGPGTPAEAGCLMDIVAYYANRLPMLGVCLGMQAIGQYFGATLSRSLHPVHGKVSVIHLDVTDPLFAGLPHRLSVTRYHSLVLTAVVPPLRVTAATATDEVMAIWHQTLPVGGVQFHPEAVLTEGGLTMLHNFTSIKPSIR